MSPDRSVAEVPGLYPTRSRWRRPSARRKLETAIANSYPSPPSESLPCVLRSFSTRTRTFGSSFRVSSPAGSYGGHEMNTGRSAFARALALAFVVVLSGVAFAQTPGSNIGSQTRVQQVASGEKTKIKGVIVLRDPDTIMVRDWNNISTVVALTDMTSVKSNGGWFRTGTNYEVTNLLRGLIVEVEGTGNASGQLVAKKIRFDKDDLKAATATGAAAGRSPSARTSTRSRLTRSGSRTSTASSISRGRTTWKTATSSRPNSFDCRRSTSNTTRQGSTRPTPGTSSTTPGCCLCT